MTKPKESKLCGGCTDVVGCYLGFNGDIDRHLGMIADLCISATAEVDVDTLGEVGSTIKESLLKKHTSHSFFFGTPMDHHDHPVVEGERARLQSMYSNLNRSAAIHPIK